MCVCVSINFTPVGAAHSKSGGSSSLDVATGTRRPTPPGAGEVTIASSVPSMVNGNLCVPVVAFPRLFPIVFGKIR